MLGGNRHISARNSSLVAVGADTAAIALQFTPSTERTSHRRPARRPWDVAVFVGVIPISTLRVAATRGLRRAHDSKLGVEGKTSGEASKLVERK